MTTTSDLSQTTAPPLGLPPPYPNQQRFAEIVGCAEEGDDNALEELQHLLDHHDSLWAPLATMERMVERHLVNVAAGNSQPMRGRITRFIANVRHDLLA